MGLFNEVLNSVGQMAAPVEPDDYTGDDGLRRCGKCHTPKEAILSTLHNLPVEIAGTVFGHDGKVPIMCKCRQEKLDREEAEFKHREEAQRILRLRLSCFHSADDANCTFDRDDRRDVKVSNALQLYADNFAENRKINLGLLLHGPVGTGKTFFAACIANHLLEQGYSVEMTSFTRIVNTIQGMYEGKQAYIDQLMRRDLLIIDDLGVERESEFMQEQVTAIVDARYKSKRPLIITTNIGLDEIKKPKNLAYRRIYDRLLEICHPVKVDGPSRRRAAVRDHYAERNALLGL